MRRESRRLVVLVVALVLAASWGCKKNPGPQVGEPAPGFALPDLDGKLHSLDDFRGQVVVLNYWATWCPPCVDEMPSLERLHEALSDKGLTVVAVSVDERFDDIVKFVDAYDLSFTILHDEGMKVARSYQSFKYPETYIIDREGKMRSKVVGARDWVAPAVIRDMVSLLNEPQRES